MINKIVTLIVVSMIAIAGQCTEYPLNPDRFPSFGINYRAYSLAGDYVGHYMGDIAGQECENTGSNLTFDAILPTSDCLSLNFGFGFIVDQMAADETTRLVGGDRTASGYSFNVVFRYYFNK